MSQANRGGDPRSLYDAARSEAPDPGVKERALASLIEALHSSPRESDAGSGGSMKEAGRGPVRAFHRPTLAPKVAIVMFPLAIAAAAAWVLWAGARGERLQLGPEPVAHREPKPVLVPPATARPRATPEPPQAGSRRSALASSSGMRRAPSPSAVPPSLTLEIELLDRARSALSRGEPQTALRELDAFQHKLRGVRLKDEAALLEISALQRLGRIEESHALASKFIDDHPDSPLVERAQQLLGTGGGGNAN